MIQKNKNKRNFFEEGRMVSIEIENTWINIAYLPVNTEPVDKINLCYEGISDIIMKGYD